MGLSAFNRARRLAAEAFELSATQPPEPEAEFLAPEPPEPESSESEPSEMAEAVEGVDETQPPQRNKQDKPTRRVQPKPAQ